MLYLFGKPLTRAFRRYMGYGVWGVGGLFLRNLAWTKPFFSGLDTLPQGGWGCLPAFLEILGALSGITPPPPVGVGQEWVGIFWGKYL